MKTGDGVVDVFVLWVDDGESDRRGWEKIKQDQEF